jgi:diguanylate cyclase (GGDEF)-like protein/PAS domain S-box-containing protein
MTRDALGFSLPLAARAMPHRLDQSSPSRTARFISLAYAAIAASWILVSDWLVALPTPGEQDLVPWQTAKGLGFVAVTSALLFLLLRSRLKQHQETERRFETLVESLPGIAYRCENDHSWTIRYVSRSVHLLTGYAPEELIGNATIAYAALIHPEDREPVCEQIQQALKADRAFRVEYRLRRRDGRLIWVWEQGRGVPDINRRGQLVLEGLMLDVTERKQAEAAAKETAERLESLGDNLPGGAIYRLHRTPSGEYRFTYASKGIEQILGISRERMLADATAAFELTEQPYRDAVHQANERSVRDLSLFEMELPQCLPDGSRKWIAVRSLPYRSADRGVFWDGIVMDITERKAVEEKLREAAAVFASTAEGVVITALDGEIRDVNPAFCGITGYRKEEVIGQNPRLLKSDRHDRSFYQRMWQSLEGRGQWHGEIWNRRKDGAIYPELLTISVVSDQQGQATGYVGVFADITSLKESEARLDHLAHHDPLTNLPNRLLFDARLGHAIHHAARNHGALAVLFTDLDRFKHINDSLGHPAGDQLLQQFSRRLTDTLRAEDTVARISGDEFVVLLEAVEGATHVAPVARKLIEALKEPFLIEGSSVRVTASIGISLYPDDGNTVAALLRNADAAMYRAKEEGGNSYAFYTAEMTAAAFEHVFLENALRGALERDEFRLLYQPQIDLESGRLLGVEALLRWHHPEEGVIPPMRFIPIAEQTGLILEIGRWVLRCACAQARRWLDQGFEFDWVGVNVAGRQVHDREFVGDVERTLAETGLPASCLELEISENFVMRRADSGVEKLQTLHAKGVGIAIDDFGTGYSCLSHLKRLPISRLKLDQGFVRGIPDEQDDMAICDAVIAMSRALSLAVIAEGVETEDQAAFLSGKGCRVAQGFLFGRPMPPEAIERLLEAAG